MHPPRGTSCSLFVRPRGLRPRTDRAPEGSPDSRLPAAPGAPPLLHAGSAPAAGQGSGAGRLPLGPKVPGRLPPGVAAGWGPRQQECDAGGPEEQSGPHDRRWCVPRARLGSGAARGRGLPALAPPPGAAGSEPASPELARGAEQGGWGRREEGPGAAHGWGVSSTSERNTQKAAPPSRRWPPGEAQSPRRGQRSGTPGAGFSPWPTPPARVWESAS